MSRIEKLIRLPVEVDPCMRAAVFVGIKPAQFIYNEQIYTAISGFKGKAPDTTLRDGFRVAESELVHALSYCAFIPDVRRHQTVNLSTICKITSDGSNPLGCSRFVYVASTYCHIVTFIRGDNEPIG